MLSSYLAAISFLFVILILALRHSLHPLTNISFFFFHFSYVVTEMTSSRLSVRHSWYPYTWHRARSFFFILLPWVRSFPGFFKSARSPALFKIFLFWFPCFPTVVTQPLILLSLLFPFCYAVWFSKLDILPSSSILCVTLYVTHHFPWSRVLIGSNGTARGQWTRGEWQGTRIIMSLLMCHAGSVIGS